MADFIYRYKSVNDEVIFNVGLDENGLKIFESSKLSNIPTQEYVDNLSLKWIEFCKLFQIEYTSFYRTTSKEHKEKVQKFWNYCLDSGDLYKKEYSAKYCVGCESFKTDKELISGKCPDHPNLDISEVSEENWFFKLTKYKKDILEYVIKNDFLNPKNKLPELINQIENCEDISVSRKKIKVKWGIEVPNDPDQIIYVWFDALLNYIIAAGWGDENFEELWKTSVQICGPDNLKFQGLIFQSFLKSQNIPFSKKLIVHGTVTDSNGDKISKTVGNVIDPIEQLNKYGLEAVRYYILSLNTYSNNSWIEDNLVKIYNSEVVDGFGNLISRVLHLIDRNQTNIINPSKEFKKTIDDISIKAKNSFDSYEIRDGVKFVSDIVRYCNVYVNETKPWGYTENYGILSNLYYALNIISEYYKFILPSKYNEIKKALGDKKKIILFNKLILKN